MNTEWERLIACIPEKDGKSIDWEALEKTALSPYFSKMASTPQQAEYHGEGDVYTHTKLVCEQLVHLDGFRRLDERRRQALFVAALLHDVAKPNTTKLIDGKLSSPHHGPIGSQMARKILWTEFDMAGSEEAQRLRETVCLLIRYHTAPPNAMRKSNPELFLRKIAANGALAADFSPEMLCLLSEADILGRISDDGQAMREMVRLCAMQAEEAGCLYHPYAFPNAYTAHAYLSGRKIQPDAPLYDDTWGEVIMLCGLPGTGKDTWIQKNLPDLPMLSLDEIRREYRVKPTDDQGRVIQEAEKRAKTMLAAKKSFVFNATNVSDMMRGKWAHLFEQYHAGVRIVYLETAWQENLRRNALRKETVPENVIDKLLDKLTLPEMFEAQHVEWKAV